MIAFPCVANHNGWISGKDGKVGKITLNITVGGNDASFSDFRVRHDRRMRSNKGVFSNVHAPRDVANHFFTRIGFPVQTNGLMT